MKLWAKLKKTFLPILLITALYLNLVSSVLLNPPHTLAESTTDSVKADNAELEKLLGEYNSASDLNKGSKLSQMKEVASERKPKLHELYRSDSADALSLVIDASKYPSEVQVDLEKKITETGKYEYAHFDGGTEQALVKSGEKEQYINLTGTRTSPAFSGKTVTVTGYQIENDILSESIAEETSQLQVQGASEGGAFFGTKSMAVLYLKFSNSSSRRINSSMMSDYFHNTFPNFIRTSSNNKVDIDADIYNLDVSDPTTCDLGLMRDIANAAAASNPIVPIDLTAYQYKMMIVDHGCVGEDRSFTGKAFTGGTWAFSVGTGSVAHEFGHNMGLAHATNYDCGEDIIRDNCTVNEYYNFADIMGRGPHLFHGDYGPYAKDYLGWYNYGELVEVNDFGTHTIYEQDEPNSPKALKIKTVDGGKKYYVSLPDQGNTISNYEGPTVELAWGDLSTGFDKRTFLLDMTPNSSTLGHVTDISDAPLVLGQEFFDPFNGVVIKLVAEEDDEFTKWVTIQVSRLPATAFKSEIGLTINRPSGFVSAAGQKKDIDWADINYVLSHRCTYGYQCTGEWEDNPPTTNNFGSWTVASSDLGYQYEYKVSIVTLKDTNHNEVASYPWVNPAPVSNDCGGQTSCTQGMYWETVDYNATLFRKDNGSEACVGWSSIGCIDEFAVDVSQGTFRGIPADVTFKGDVRVKDVNNNEHFLKEWSDLGVSESLVRTCNSGGTNCTIGFLSFVGLERILWRVNKGDANGTLIWGLQNDFANGDGSFNANWRWNYVVEVYKGDSCTGASCQKRYIYDSVRDYHSITFNALEPGQYYNVNVCAVDCSQASNSLSGFPVAVQSSFWDGPGFFDDNNFSIAFDTDGDGCLDTKELGPDKVKGGQRNPNSEWDFADVPTPVIKQGSTSAKNKAVTLADVSAVLAYVGTRENGSKNAAGYDYDTDFNGNNIPDGKEYDRTPSADPTKPWQSGPPNGAVTLQDVGVVLAQVGHNCN